VTNDGRTNPVLHTHPTDCTTSTDCMTPADYTNPIHYTNPILNADWSDPDVVRVGDDFYLTASGFGRAPGLPLLHSRDLVNWTLVGHALQLLEPADEFRIPRLDCGVWAPSLRHHDDHGAATFTHFRIDSL
jgi:beta-xylosidase